LTVRGAELVARCPVVLYTGSLVPREVLATARAGARVLDSSSMTLEQIVEVLVAARDADEDVARVHTGDPSLFGSTAEQLRRMDELGIPWEIVPGVSSFTAAAAVLGKELTLPELSQTVILTRAEGRTPMPPRERLESLAEHQATLALFLSVNLLEDVTRALIPAYGADCPVAVVHKATCPDQAIVTGTLEDIRAKVRAAGIRSQSMILVGRVLTSTNFANSRLYAADFTHRFRKGQKPERAPLPAPPPPIAPKDTTKPARKGQLLVYTGHGKGKTTAALGLVFRALGRGLRVLVVQFIKGKWKTGERLFAENVPGLTFLVMGRGFTWESDDISRDRRAACEAWRTARDSILKGDHDVVVLDELTYAINYGFLEIGEVLASFRERPERVHVVVTGRNAPNELLEAADLVTEMRPVKHPFERGIPAQPGIDF
jgi:precorrin-4/cobalt-precorrin-4 C11-methyltransferase